MAINNQQQIASYSLVNMFIYFHFRERLFLIKPFLFCFFQIEPRSFYAHVLKNTDGFSTKE